MHNHNLNMVVVPCIVCAIIGNVQVSGRDATRTVSARTRITLTMDTDLNLDLHPDSITAKGRVTDTDGRQIVCTRVCGDYYHIPEYVSSMTQHVY